MTSPSYKEMLQNLTPETRAMIEGKGKRICQVCDKEFNTRNTRRIFCSDKCRMAYHTLKRLVAKLGVTNGRVDEEAS